MAPKISAPGSLSRRGFLTSLLGVGATVALAACSSSQSSGSGSSAGTSGSAAPTKPAATAAAAPASGANPAPTAVVPVTIGKGSKKLTVWHYYGQAQAEPLAKIVEGYQQVDPNLSFELTFTPGAQLLAKIQTAIAGNAVPDIVQTDLVWVPIMIDTGKTVALDDYFKEANFDIKDFFDALLQYDQGEDGKYYAVPMDTNNIQIFYNKNMVQAAGLDFEKSPPATWEALTEAAAKMTNTDKKQWGLDLGAETTQGAQGALANRHMCLVWQTGGKYFDDKGGRPERGAPVFNKGGGVAAWQWNVDIIQKQKAVPIQPPQNGFVTGLEGMWYNGPWAIPDTMRLIGSKFEMGVIPFPAQTPELAGTSWSGGEHFQAFKGKNQDDSAKFILWLTSPKNIETYAENAGYIPTRQSVINGDSYKAWLDKNPNYKVYAQNMSKVHPRVPTRLFFDLTIAISQRLEEAIYQKSSVQDALNAAADDSLNVMKQKGYQWQ
ncbi:MAG TPA: ABC transporter substrate-binding protein [Chloroflexota bacterium]|nr:ABC transporter substrate-binding protein [Chloroflexota bacterium]